MIQFILEVTLGGVLAIVILALVVYGMCMHFGMGIFDDESEDYERPTTGPIKDDYDAK